MTAPRTHSTARKAGVLATALALVASGCMFQGDDEQKVSSNGMGPLPVESGMPEDPKPTRGGQLVYGVEAETDLGYCLPEAQIAASGIQIVRSIYDPLTIPDGKGGYAPYLAKTIDHDESYKTWTITLRSGITFHDGTALDATVVKNNLDAYRGQYPGRSPLLFIFQLMDIADVEVVNELTVRVTTRRPWVAFPSTLYSSGRLAIVAQAQLDADKETCAERPIGTGPFSFVSWERDVSLKVRRNPKYWQEAPDGKPYPYLDAIDFRPVPNTDERLAGLQSGELNMLHTSSATDIARSLTQLQSEDAINLMISSERTETSYLMINAENEALADHDLRIAIAQAVDKEKLNKLANAGFATIADGPFAPEVLGYLDDPGGPEYDLDAAKKGVAAAKAKGLSTAFVLVASTDTISGRSAIIMRDMLEAAGLEITIETESQAVLVERTIEGDYDLTVFRQQPGDDPDANFNWFAGDGNPLNFANFDDPVISDALLVGRTTADPKKRKAAYETVSRQFGKEQWHVYLYYALWAVAEARNVHGILGPDLPDDAGPPPARLVTGHSVHGIWIDKD